MSVQYIDMLIVKAGFYGIQIAAAESPPHIKRPSISGMTGAVMTL